MGSSANKVILVTGGSRGLGAKLVERLSGSRDNTICFTYRNSQEKAEKLASSLQNTIALKCDQQDEAQVKKCIAEVKSRFGRLDILINNACPAFRPCDLALAGWGSFQDILDVNVKGAYFFIREASEIMKEQGHGKIINILSSYVLGTPPEKLSFYVTAKYALLGLTRSAAVELVRYGITVNAVAPGLMSTDLSSHLPPKYLEVYSSRHPMKRMAETSDVAGVVEFLTSDSAGFLNGVNIPVNGGEML
jgi:3-oxoacyl-[acyl-carrier protein] reductase